MCCQGALAARVQLHMQPQQQQLRLNRYARHGRIIPTLFSLNSCSPLLSVCVPAYTELLQIESLGPLKPFAINGKMFSPLCRRTLKGLVITLQSLSPKKKVEEKYGEGMTFNSSLTLLWGHAPATSRLTPPTHSFSAPPSSTYICTIHAPPSSVAPVAQDTGHGSYRDVAWR